MNAQKLQDDIRNTVQQALSGKSGELTAADLSKVRDAVDKKLDAAEQQADQASGSQR